MFADLVAWVLVEQVKVTLEVLNLMFSLVWEFSDLEGSLYVLEWQWMVWLF